MESFQLPRSTTPGWRHPVVVVAMVVAVLAMLFGGWRVVRWGETRRKADRLAATAPLRAAGQRLPAEVHARLTALVATPPPPPPLGTP